MVCYVYVIALDREKGPSKVGIASDPKKRLAGLQTAHHQKLHLVGHWETPDRSIARVIEDSFHQVMAADRLSGEWFDMPPKRCMALLLFALGTALNAHTNFTSDEINEIISMSRFDYPEAS